MRRRRSLGLAMVLPCAVFAGGLADEAAAQTKPAGEMRWALYVMLSPVWFDPGEVSGQLTPFCFLYALHDALVKPMPGNPTSAPTSSNCAKASSSTTGIPSPPRA